MPVPGSQSWSHTNDCAANRALYPRRGTKLHGTTCSAASPCKSAAKPRFCICSDQVKNAKRFSLERSLLDVDAVEVVAAERRQLEVDDLLAHRLQLHRVRDGEPGRLLLE